MSLGWDDLFIGFGLHVEFMVSNISLQIFSMMSVGHVDFQVALNNKKKLRLILIAGCVPVRNKAANGSVSCVAYLAI